MKAGEEKKSKSGRSVRGHALRVKRIYEEASAEDGCRVLVDRLWPRGVSKARAAVDRWAKEAAPSAELRKWYGHDPARLEEFRARYLAELEESPAAAAFAEEIGRILQDQDVTLLYGAKVRETSHALVLRDWVKSRLPDMP